MPEDTPWLAPWYGQGLPSMQPAPTPQYGDDYVDAPSGSPRARLEAQRRGESQYGTIPQRVAERPLEIGALVAGGVLAPELLNLPVPALGGTVLSNAGLMGASRLAAEGAQQGLEAAGAPEWVQTPASIAASMFPYTRGSWVQRAAQMGLQTAGLMGGEAAGRRAGLPEIPGFGNVGGIAGGLGANSVQNRLHVNPPHIVNPSDVDMYHGTYGSPGPGGKPFEFPDPEFAGNHYGNVSVPNSTYWSFDPKIAAQEGAGMPPTATPSWGLAAGARMYPATLKKGAVVWDPAQDPWPAGFEHAENAYKGKSKFNDIWGDTMAEDQKAPLFDRIGMLYDKLKEQGLVPELKDPGPYDLSTGPTQEWKDWARYGSNKRNALVDALRKDYEGIITPYENIMFSHKNVVPKYGGEYNPLPEPEPKMTFRKQGEQASILGPEDTGVKDSHVPDWAATPEEMQSFNVMHENPFSPEAPAHAEALLKRWGELATPDGGVLWQDGMTKEWVHSRPNKAGMVAHESVFDNFDDAWASVLKGVEKKPPLPEMNQAFKPLTDEEVKQIFDKMTPTEKKTAVKKILAKLKLSTKKSKKD